MKWGTKAFLKRVIGAPIIQHFRLKKMQSINQVYISGNILLNNL